MISPKISQYHFNPSHHFVTGMTLWCPTSWLSAMTAENGPPSTMDTLTGWVHRKWCHFLMRHIKCWWNMLVAGRFASPRNKKTHKTVGIHLELALNKKLILHPVPPSFFDSFLPQSLWPSCSLETVIRTFQWWTSWQSPYWPGTSESFLRAGTALCVWGWRSSAAPCTVRLNDMNPLKIEHTREIN